MARNGVTLTWMAGVLGLRLPTLCKHMSSETMPVEHHQALVSSGVPAEALPLPLDVPRGRKPKATRSSVAHT